MSCVCTDCQQDGGCDGCAECLGERVVALQAEVVRLREALEGLVAWENYDVEYADEATIREHDADYARARAALKEDA